MSRITIVDAINRSTVQVTSEKVTGEGRLLAVWPVGRTKVATKARVLVGGRHYTVPIEAVEIIEDPPLTPTGVGA